MSDERPALPERPLPADCCGGGCDPCVYDLHAEAMEEYARVLELWEARQSPPAAGKAGAVDALERLVRGRG